MTKHIIRMIRKKLGLKKGERFRFANQKSELNRYYFTDTLLMKENWNAKGNFSWTTVSSVSLNHLLSDECEIVKCPAKLSGC